MMRPQVAPRLVRQAVTCAMIAEASRIRDALGRSALLVELAGSVADAPLVDLAVEAPPVRLAQLELLQLAGGGPGQGVAHFDRGRAFEMRQP